MLNPMADHREGAVPERRRRGGVASVEQRLLATLRERGAQTIEQLAAALPDVSWSQVFLAIDWLSRYGEVSLLRVGRSDYRVLLKGM